MRNPVILALLPLAAACGGAGTTAPVSAPPPRVATARPATPPPTNPGAVGPSAAASAFRAPKVMTLPGIEGLIGANAAALVRQFGIPRLDVREGDARKLQFSGQPCVLDVWLYPLQPGAEPTATYVEARRASDGLDVDRTACVQALLRRQG